MNTFGTLFRLTSFGESHGNGIGAVIDGCPSGIRFDADMVQRDLNRRRPGQALTTRRNEPDEAEVLSGLYDGITIGSPITLLVRNRDHRSKDYDHLKDVYRPSHADFTYQAKYGVRDHRGGGRSSARETLARVIGGAVARMVLREQTDIEVKTAVTRLGSIECQRPLSEMSAQGIYESPCRVDDLESEKRYAEYIERLREDGDSTGGVVSVRIDGVKPGLGEPIYQKLNAKLAEAMMSINGATGFEVGAGFRATERLGSENNDVWVEENGAIRTATNNSGGIQGGISNGMPIEFNVAFKPPSSIGKPQSHATKDGDVIEHAIVGRHDPSIVIRAVSVVEAMALLVLSDMWLIARARAIEN